MSKGIDPAQLLRRSWDGPGGADALAYELYVMFTAAAKPAAPAPGIAAAPSRPALAAAPAPAPAARRPAPAAAALGLAHRAAIAAAAVRSSVQPSRPDQHRVSPLAPAPARPYAAAPVAVGSQPAATATSLPPSTEVAAPVAPPPPRRSYAMTYDTGAGPEAIGDITQPSPPDIAPISPQPSPPIPSVPPEAPATRQSEAIVPPTPATAVLGAISPQQFAPGFFLNPVVLAAAAPGVAVEARARITADPMPTTYTKATEAPRKETSLEPQAPKKAREWPDLGFDQKALGYILPEGVTGLTFSTSGTSSKTLATPGTGQFYLIEFDPDTGLTYGTSMDPEDCYNLSVVPVSGGIFWAMMRIGEYFFLAQRQQFVHAIVTSAVSACVGTTPGSGQAQAYYMSKGVMTAGPTLNIENWYAVTAAIGKHCGLVEVDGTLGLEVLDC